MTTLVALDKEAVLRRATWRVVPVVTLIYLFAVIDRGNIGFAKLQMAHDLHLSEAAFGFGASLFFIGYLMFEVPSAILQNRIGARLWLARIIGTWGVVTVLLGFTSSATMFYTLRLLLGVAEAGAYPGIIFYLSLWFPQEHRVRVLGFLTLGSAFGNMFASLAGGSLLDLNGALGLAGWQWVFIATGIPAILLCFATLLLLPNTPATARFLSPAEKKWLTTAIEADKPQSTAHRGMLATLLRPAALLLSLMYTLIMIALYGVIYWLPTVVKSFGVSGTTNGVLSAIPWAVTALALILLSRHIRREATALRAMLCCGIVGLLSFAAAAFVHDSLVQLLAMSFGVPCISLLLPCFWSFPARLFRAEQAAVAIAAISSIGSVGGLVAQNAMPAVAAALGRPEGAMLVPSACLVVLVGLALVLQRGQTAARGLPLSQE